MYKKRIHNIPRNYFNVFVTWYFRLGIIKLQKNQFKSKIKSIKSTYFNIIYIYSYKNRTSNLCSHPLKRAIYNFYQKKNSA